MTRKSFNQRKHEYLEVLYKILNEAKPCTIWTKHVLVEEINKYFPKNILLKGKSFNFLIANNHKWNVFTCVNGPTTLYIFTKKMRGKINELVSKSSLDAKRD